MLISENSAAMYADAKRDELERDGIAALERYEARDVPMLADLSLEGDS